MMYFDILKCAKMGAAALVAGCPTPQVLNQWLYFFKGDNCVNNILYIYLYIIYIVL